MTTSRVWDGHEWEAYINALLSLRYPLGDYQRVPAEHGGDAGIEGFGISDGKAYQCFAPATPLPVRDLFERQRDKMTADLQKFVANRKRLEKLLGSTKISRWLLVVPEHRSAQLVAHAVTKTTEVLKASLPYVTDDFRVVVVTDADFELERRGLAAAGAIQVRIETIEVATEAVKEFATNNVPGMTNLTRKIGIALQADSAQTREELAHTLVQAYLAGQSQLESLHRSYPEVHARILTLIAQAEKRIAFESRVTPLGASELLTNQYGSLRERLIKDAPSTETIADDLVQQVIADWLMRCPLAFRASHVSAQTDMVS